MPGCTEAAITVGSQAMGSPASGVASGYSLPDLSLLLVAPLAVAALGRRKKWQRWTWPVAGALLMVAVVSTGTALADTSVMAPEVRQMPEVRVLALSEAEGSNEEVEEQRSGLLLAPVPVVQPVGDSSPAPSPAPRVQSAGAVTTTRVISYTYDPLGRLVEADYSTGESYEYAYDAVGNRTTMTATHESRTTQYEYDEANRLTSVGGVAYTWDARGNLVSDGTFTYTYNAAGRMVQAESVTVTLVYTYSANGLRVAQSVDGDVCQATIRKGHRRQLEMPMPRNQLSASWAASEPPNRILLRCVAQGANSSTAQNPTYPYIQTGVYTVGLTATGPGGSDTRTCTNYITVSSSSGLVCGDATWTDAVLPLRFASSCYLMLSAQGAIVNFPTESASSPKLTHR